ncbi:hypothetical protein K439DRAFT_1649937 [Ramaria rubella]|nr:hypothetical protein K439DRAFT_1649937 [Ramaria rubella]
MSQQTDRQTHTNKLLELFVLQTLTEGQAALLKLLDTDSETFIFLNLLAELHVPRYLQDRIHIPKNGVQLSLTLFRYKAEHPALFQSLLQVTSSTFDALLSKIQDHPVFQSNSEKQQIPVIQQLAVAGLGYGTVDKYTRWVMTAVCDDGFRQVVMRWPNDIQKAEASNWSNYSLNVQLISTPNLRIIDYGVGLPSSQHDATAWKGTWIPHEHDRLLGGDEWVWVDTAYPLQSWCQAPYKKPDKELPENARYNYYVSHVRVQSEHCMGFLKGQWSSLRGLWLHIDRPAHIRFATIWVSTCIVLHNFAMVHEAEEGEGGDVELNEFFREGLSLLEEEERLREGRNAHGGLIDDEHEHAGAHDVELIRGQLRREELKQMLFEHLQH